MGSVSGRLFLITGHDRCPVPERNASADGEHRDQPPAGSSRQAAPAHCRSVRNRHLRGDRRSVPQEADAGDLRPGQPGAAAARLRAGRLRPAGLGNEDFAKVVHDAVRQYARTPFSEEVWRHLAEGFRFVQGAFDDDTAFDNLAATLGDLDRVRGTGGNHAFYFSIPPGAFPVVLQQLKRSGLCDPHAEEWRRVVIEKPFGHDLKSAQELNALVNDVFPSDSVFRIDHYLGKETVQNLLALRFANELYEPIWNNNYVDHVQITQAEDIGVGGRAGYYDGIGAARDVIQNHLLQLMALTAMEEPVAFNPKDLRREKVKVLSAVTCPRTCPSARPAASTPAAGRAARRCSATWRRTASRRSPPPRPTPPSSSWWRPGGGPGCRSTCAPASGSASGSPRSRSSSNALRTNRSRRTTPRNSGPTCWSSGSSRTRA